MYAETVFDEGNVFTRHCSSNGAEAMLHLFLCIRLMHTCDECQQPVSTAQGIPHP